jgi:hypothetical protein
LQITAGDPDPEDTLSFSAANLPPGLTIDPETGLISGVIGYNASTYSPYTVTITVMDNGLPAPMSDSAEIQWFVSDVEWLYMYLPVVRGGN